MSAKLRISLVVGACALAGVIALRSARRVRHSEGFPTTLPSGALANFQLFDADGHGHELYRYGDSQAVVIFSFGASCPIVEKSVGSLRQLAESFRSRGVAFLALDANSTDSREAIRKEAANYGFDWPVLRDTSQLVARELGLRRMGEVVLVDTRAWKVVYRGMVDDHLGYGVNKGEARQFFLRDALEAVLGGGAPAAAEIPGKGCAITFREDDRALAYGRDIAPILEKKCLNCHSQAGQTKPYFSSYEQVSGWTAMIRETVLTGRMPIWGVDSEPGEFLNDASLSPEEKRRLVTWIDQGAKRGEGSDPLPAFAPQTDTRIHGGHSYMAEMNEPADVPPEGFDEYNYYQLGGPLPRDMWVDYIQSETDNPRVMHHATLNVMPEPLSYYRAWGEAHPRMEMSARPEDRGPDASKFRIHNGFLADLDERARAGVHTLNSPYSEDEPIRFNAYSSYGRNNRKVVPRNTAFFLPKGFFLILEAHHEGTGRPEKERTRIHFHEVRKTATIKPLHFIDQRAKWLSIPPYAKDFRVDIPDFHLSHDIELLACTAHIHTRGKEAHVWAELPNGQKQALLSIPGLDYTWHPGAPAYFAHPPRLPKGAVIKSYVVMDNSPMNPNNPDPSAQVIFGPRLREDEMAKLNCIFTIRSDRQSDGQP